MPRGVVSNPSSLVIDNGVAERVTPVRRLPWYRWLPVWPFFFIYTVQIVLYADPTLVWPTTTYLIWLKYIDFFHSVLFGIIIFSHSFFALLTQWSIRANVYCLYNTLPRESIVARVKARTAAELDATPSAATHVLVSTKPHHGKSMIVALQKDTDGSAFFLFQQRKWRFDTTLGVFVKPQFPTHLSFKTYEKEVSLRTDAQISAALNAFGRNLLDIQTPTFFELFVDHAFAPFFVFQMFCVLLWCMDEYWQYSLFSGFMMIMLECTVVFQRLRNTKTLRQMGEVPMTSVWTLRKDKWVKINHTELLPLDVILVPSNAPCPADILVISGTAVVNEAMLTGESTPQMKEAIPSECSDALVMKKYARHILFSGTSILVSSSASGHSAVASPATKHYPAFYSGPDGAVGVVLKTGFETKQGKLVRTILHSQGRISENSGEAFAFIGFLLIFACAAVIYTLKRGLADSGRSRWKLFLTCTQILTSVVPAELPMELSLTVNTTLLSLMKLKVFCTEPFRIPFAGKVDTCCFDKTGTLTTDEMLFCGVDACDGQDLRNTADKIPATAEAVLASCHSLVMIPPPEAPAAGTAATGAAAAAVPPPPEGLAGDAMEKAAVETLGWKCPKSDISVKEPKDGRARKLTVLTRFPFNPTIRRMSCIVAEGDDKYIVCKGSPESIESVLQSVPTRYSEVCASYTKRGYRVIALAYRPLQDTERGRAALASMKREDAESGELQFVGFAVFSTPMKSDSAATIANLQGGSHRCTIITGDNIDTAIAAAKQVGIISTPKRPALVNYNPHAPHHHQQQNSQQMQLQQQQQEKSSSSSAAAVPPVVWVTVDDATNTPVVDPKAILAADLCVNADATVSKAQFARIVQEHADRVAVWARCAPDQKEDIVSDLKAKGRMVLMAGDGTNDVGGLKQAHVGIAVLNSTLVAANQATAQVAAASVVAGGLPNTPLGQMAANYKVTPMPPPLRPNAGFGESMKHQFQVAKRQAETKHKERLEAEAKKQALAAAQGTAPPAAGTAAALPTATPTGGPLSFEQQIEAMSGSAFNDMDDTTGAPLVKLGDASIAAPFTSRSKKMNSVCDIVRLGRAALVTTLQMYKILALNCLNSAYSMSVLQSDGVKYGDRQMVVSGVVISICFLLISRCRPVETLSKQRPITRVFHPYMITSILAQFAIHLYSMMSCVDLVRSVDSEAMAVQRGEVDVPDFRPTLLNSIMFLNNTLMTLTTFLVNYRGRPFMTSLTENKGLLYLIGFLGLVIFMLASESSAELSELMEIVKFPSEEFRDRVLQILCFDMVASFVSDRFAKFVFVRD